MNIGQFATHALKSGKTAKETLELVHRVFPQSNTTMKGIYYYASKAGIKQKVSTADPLALAEALRMLEPANAPTVKTGTDK